MLVSALVFLSFAAPSFDETDGPVRVRLPRPFVERPLTVPADHFEVRLTGAFRSEVGGDWSVPLLAGAGYGFTDDIELGVELIRLSLVPANSESPDSDFLAPTVYGSGKLTLGAVDLGTRLDIELPLQGLRAAELRLLGRLRLARRIRFDLGWSLGVVAQDGDAAWPSQLPIELSIQVVPSLAVRGGGRLASDDLWRRTDLRFVGEAGLVWTVGNRARPPLVDLKASLLFPSVAVRGDPRQEGWGFGLAGILYFDDPTNEPSSLF